MYPPTLRKLDTVIDSIQDKPACSPICDHSQVCVKCGRPKCRDYVIQHRSRGLMCFCGGGEWRVPVEREDGLSMTSWDMIHVTVPSLASINVRDVHRIVLSLPQITQFELITQVLSDNKQIMKDVKKWARVTK